MILMSIQNVVYAKVMSNVLSIGFSIDLLVYWKKL